jgi:hypothetical protein
MGSYYIESRVKTPVGTVLPRLEQWPYSTYGVGSYEEFKTLIFNFNLDEELDECPIPAPP